MHMTTSLKKKMSDLLVGNLATKKLKERVTIAAIGHIDEGTAADTELLGGLVNHAAQRVKDRDYATLQKQVEDLNSKLAAVTGKVAGKNSKKKNNNNNNNTTASNPSPKNVRRGVHTDASLKNKNRNPENDTSTRPHKRQRRSNSGTVVANAKPAGPPPNVPPPKNSNNALKKKKRSGQKQKNKKKHK
jgi:hypothetical protein